LNEFGANTLSNLRLTLPEPKIDLYESGFEGICKLDRAQVGKKLSNLVESIAEPMVIAVDAPWGAGKSVFLRCWVGAHQCENSGTAKTVYFDAFKHDYMDDPLIGLVSEISTRFEGKRAQKGLWKTAKEAASKLSRPAARVGLAVATAGASEIAVAVVDAALKAGSMELENASEEFWKKEDGRRAAMDGFRAALATIAKNERLVVVDELDRCRPDYALGLLEVVKHFFDVPNVHFVLGVNLRELANSVKSRYGAGVQSDKYLQKFITVSMPLVGRNPRTSKVQAPIKHFKNVSQQIGLSSSWKADWIVEYLNLVDWDAGLTLRDVERIATLAIVTPEPSGRSEVLDHLYIGSLILSVASPKFSIAVRNQALLERDISRVLNIERNQRQGAPLDDAIRIWRLIAKDQNSSISAPDDETLAELFIDQNPRDVLREVVADCLGTFELMN